MGQVRLVDLVSLVGRSAARINCVDLGFCVKSFAVRPNTGDQSDKQASIRRLPGNDLHRHDLGGGATR